MARKEPYSLVKVNRKIYDALKKRLVGDNSGHFKLPSMNAYIEQILWDYVQGNLAKLGRSFEAGVVVESRFDGENHATPDKQSQPGSRRKSAG